VLVDGHQVVLLPSRFRKLLLLRSRKSSNDFRVSSLQYVPPYLAQVPPSFEDSYVAGETETESPSLRRRFKK